MAATLTVKGDAKGAIKALKDVGIEAKETAKKTKKSGKTITSSMVKGTLAFVGITTAANLFKSGLTTLAGTVKSTTIGVAELGNAYAKQSEMLGITTQQYQTLDFAAKRAGIGTQTMTNGLKKLSRTMVDAQNGSRQIEATFGALEVTLKKQDGTLRDVFDVYAELTTKFSEMGKGAEVGGAAMLILGRSGTETIGALSRGGEQLKEMLERLKELGAIASPEMISSSEDFKDRLVDLEYAAMGVKFVMAEELLPTLSALLDNMIAFILSVNWEDWADVLEEGLLSVIGMFDVLAEKVDAAKDSLGIFGKIVGFTAKAALRNNFITKFADRGREALGLLGDDVADSGTNWTEFGKKLKRQIAAMGAMRDAAGAGDRALAKYNKELAALDRLIKKWTQGHEGMQQSIRGLKEEIELFGKEGIDLLLTEQMFDKEKVKAEFDELQKMLVEQATFITNSKVFDAEERERRLGEIGERARKAHLARTEQDLLIETLTSKKILEIRREELAAMDEMDRAAYEERMSLLADYERAQMDAAATVMDSIVQFAEAVTTIISTVYGEQSKEAKEAARALFFLEQAVALGRTIVLGQVAIQQAAASAPPPYNVPAIVAQSAILGANIATIVATTVAGIADAGLPPGALRAAGLNNHTVLAVGNDEMVLDPVGTRAISQMLQQQVVGRGANDPVVVNTTLEIDGRVLGQTVDNHLIRSKERGLPYSDRVRYGNR